LQIMSSNKKKQTEIKVVPFNVLTTLIYSLDIVTLSEL